MLVVSDTSPISNLSIIGRLGLLRSQFGEIWIPGAVRTELDSLPNPSGQTRIQRALSDSWIRPRAVEQNRMLTLLRSNLDSGEAEAIALAVELSAHLVLLDERDARNVADRARFFVSSNLELEVLRWAGE